MVRLSLKNLFFIISILLIFAGCKQSTSESKGQKPNFVIILSDDLAYGDLGFMGNNVVQTPNLDKLAAEGAFYPNGYLPVSVCRPSLATFLTGLYPHQHGIHFNHPSPGFSKMKTKDAQYWIKSRAASDYMIRAVPTLPKILAENGYVCLQTGKLWEGDWKNAGFTHGMTLNKPSPEPAYGNLQVASGEWVAHGNGDAGLNIGRDTMEPIYDFIREHKNQPFMIWYAPFLPHAPFDSDQRYVNLYANRKEVPEFLIPYYASITRYDDTVGELMKFLKENNLDENTIVILMNDNGFKPDNSEKNAEKGYINADTRSKLSPYENGVRTPVVIRWKGKVKPGIYTELVQSVDLVPTVLAAAGLENAIPYLSGINLMPSALGKEKLPDRPAFGEIYPNDAQSLGHPSDHVYMRFVRYGDFKLIIPEPKNYDGELELYNLKEDPDELNNLARNPEYAGKIKELHKMADDWWTPGDDSQVAKPE